MVEVSLAEETQLPRKIALKMLLGELTLQRRLTDAARQLLTVKSSIIPTTRETMSRL